MKIPHEYNSNESWVEIYMKILEIILFIIPLNQQYSCREFKGAKENLFLSVMTFMIIPDTGQDKYIHYFWATNQDKIPDTNLLGNFENINGVWDLIELYLVKWNYCLVFL